MNDLDRNHRHFFIILVLPLKLDVDYTIHLTVLNNGGFAENTFLLIANLKILKSVPDAIIGNFDDDSKGREYSIEKQKSN